MLLFKMPPSKHTAEVLFSVPKHKKAVMYLMENIMWLKREKPNLEQGISDFSRNYKLKKKKKKPREEWWQKEGCVKVPEM